MTSLQFRVYLRLARSALVLALCAVPCFQTPTILAEPQPICEDEKSFPAADVHVYSLSAFRFNRSAHEPLKVDSEAVMQQPAAGQSAPCEKLATGSLVEHLPKNINEIVRQQVEDFATLLNTLSCRDYDRYLELFTDYGAILLALQDRYPKVMWPKVTAEERAGWVKGLYDQVYCYLDPNSPQYYLSVRNDNTQMILSPIWKFPSAAYFLVPGARLDIIEFRQRPMGGASVFLKLEFKDRESAPWDQRRTNEVKNDSGDLLSWTPQWVRIKQMIIKLDVPGPNVSRIRWRQDLRQWTFGPGPADLLDYSYYQSTDP